MLRCVVMCCLVLCAVMCCAVLLCAVLCCIQHAELCLSVIVSVAHLSRCVDASVRPVQRCLLEDLFESIT
jgi:hypothetical protein